MELVVANNKKFTQEYVESFFKDKGCELKSQYKNTDTHLEYICKCGTQRSITFNKFKQQKHGCRVCTGLEKHTQEFVADYFKQYNCELLSTYEHALKLVQYRCSCGEISEITFDNFKNKNKRCLKCGLDKLAEHFKLDTDYVRQYFIDNNCIPLFKEYKNVHTRLQYICECGNESEIQFSDFQSGKRCWECKSERTRKTMYENNSGVCSKQQMYIHRLIGGEMNYPVRNLSLDIAFPDEMIYLEYDGGGHDLSVKLGSKSQEEFEEHEKRRVYVLHRRGWKQIRLVSRKDNLPSEDKIKEMFAYAKNIFNHNSWVVFDVDNGTITTSHGTQDYSYGKVDRFR